MLNVRKIFWGMIFSVSFGLAGEVIYQAYKRSRKPKVSTVVQKKEIHDVICFAYSDKIVKKSNLTRCLITPSLEKILHYLSTATKSLDICMYVFTSADLSNIIVDLKKRGVTVRAIIDADMAFSTGSQVKRLEKYNIPVRWMKSTNLMHSKFCIIDALSEESIPFVMTGSLNWTTQALSGNWEDVLVTSQPKIVKDYSQEFARRWELFKPITMKKL